MVRLLLVWWVKKNINEIYCVFIQFNFLHPSSFHSSFCPIKMASQRRVRTACWLKLYNYSVYDSWHIDLESYIHSLVQVGFYWRTIHRNVDYLSNLENNYTILHDQKLTTSNSCHSLISLIHRIISKNGMLHYRWRQLCRNLFRFHIGRHSVYNK